MFVSLPPVYIPPPIKGSMTTLNSLQTTECLMLAQTIILLLTGGVIAWYTIVTAGIKKEMIKQNAISTEQVVIMRTTLENSIATMKSLTKPFFKYHSAQLSADWARITFINKGAQAQKVTAQALQVGCSATTQHGRFVDPEQKIEVEVRRNQTSIENCPFEIVCSDKLDQIHNFRFMYRFQQKDVIEIAS